MATSIKISQLPAKGANLEATDLLEVSEFNGTGYVSKSITGQEIIDSVSSGGVTDVTATAPVLSTGGTTPDISMAVADAGHDGYLSSTDWNTFNDKQELLVSATNIKTINGSSVLGSGDLVVSGGGGGGFNTPVPFGSGLIYANIPFGSSNVTLTAVANTIYLMPFIPAQTFTTSNMRLSVASAVSSTSARFLIYSNSVVNGLPDTLLYESIDMNTATTGVKTVTTSQTFTAGVVYWLGFYTNGASLFNACSASTQLIIGADTSLNFFNSIQRVVTYGSAPTTWGTTASKISTNFIRIGLAVA